MIEQNMDIINDMDKPDDWPANAREYVLDRVFHATEEFMKEPSYITKERLLSLVCDYDMNQRSFTGLYRITEYEVSIINSLYFWGTLCNFNALKVYLYEIIAESTRLQKNVAYMSEMIPDKMGISIETYEKGLLLQLKFFYFAYQKFTVEKDKFFAEQIIEIVNHILNEDSSEETIDSVAHAFISMMNDIGYMHGNKKFAIWKFTREELVKLFSLEIKLIEISHQSPVERPLKGVLMTQISNFVLKSRNEYNEDYICKYISSDVAKASYINHEIWMNKTENLNDDREQKVIPELFDNKEWIKHAWVRNIDFTSPRTYFVSSFSKSYCNADLKARYGECIYGFKGDRLVELLAPIELEKRTRKIETDKLFPQVVTTPRLAQVLAFDILYDMEEARQELRFLMDIIDKFPMTDNNKQHFLEELLQYWILSVKDEKWKDEKERRYVLFLYKGYDYQEMEIDDAFLKLKTTVFLMPDFVLGNNQSKSKIKIHIDNKRKAISMKNYVYCKNCLSRDYDGIIDNIRQCSICGATGIENVYLQDGE